MRKILVLILCATSLLAQRPDIPELPEGYFGLPIEHSPRLTGNFGELRDNHFHAGLDFKSSRGVPGDNLLAVADGFIQRIKIERGGYGRTLYLQHPCGLTSVYAHMSEIREDIEAYVIENQKKKEDFEITLRPDSTLFPVRKGDVIGKMGNSGHSYGPHLHFELRETNTDIPINPLFYGFDVQDDKEPEIRELFVYTFDRRHNVLSRTGIPLKREGDAWTSQATSVEVDGWRCGFGIDVIDRQNGTYNKNGVYQIETFFNNSLVHSFEATHCSFEETHEMNAHIDYARRQSHRQFVHRAHKLPNNTLSMYNGEGDGILPVYANRSGRVKIILSDFHGNRDSILLNTIQKLTDVEKESEPFQALFRFDKANYFNSQWISVYIPDDGLFTDVPIVIDPQLDENRKLESLVVGDSEVPLKKDATITIDDALLNAAFKSKACLIYKDHRSGRDRSVGSQQTPTGIRMTIPYLGKFELAYDTLAPVISVRQSITSARVGQTIKWKIFDDYEVIGNAREVRISSHINDRFYPGYYDLKSHTFSMTVDQTWPKGEVTLRIEAIDDKENSAVWSQALTIY